jgi:hypothetical protein
MNRLSTKVAPAETRLHTSKTPPNAKLADYRQLRVAVRAPFSPGSACAIT